ncbi:unnamed protein product [Bursaphelenchus okinawaensis]|uniref:Uncharacterized protein n=1 Tax=Bursaphelenchus okinawaensis TaxID=465554 RepID=A0A811L1E9_9BILA|nr:unnamed protein product [Bursaphelenchus okinawaensis]CAG9115003.1 unnamed protein product [Bursaphelenchus okinawaensis]
MTTIVGVLRPERVDWRTLFCTNRWSNYIFWFLVILFTLLTLRDLNEAVNDYLENETQTNMMMVFNESMTFPNVTFCMGKEQAMLPIQQLMQEHAKEDWDTEMNKALNKLNSTEDFLRKTWDFRLIREAVEVIGTLYTFERELMLERIPLNLLMLGKSSRTIVKRQMVQQWLSVLDDRNVTFNQFFQKTGYELIKLSLQRMKRFSPFDERDLTMYPLIKWISSSLFCFQPAAQEEFFAPIDHQGKFLNIQIRSPIAYAQHDIDCITVDFEGRSSDYERFAVGKGRSRDGVFEEMCFGTDSHLNIEIVGIYSQLANDNEGKKCTEYEGGTDTEYGCLLKCRLNFIRHVCGCTATTLQDYVGDESELTEFPLCNSYENCTLEPTQLPVNETEDDCKKECYRSCTTVQWNIQKDLRSNAAQLTAMYDNEDKIEKSGTDPNVTSINFYWKNFEYIQTEQDFEYTWSSFMGNVGGILGCWLGLSVLGIMQGSFFIYDKCAERRAKNEESAETTSMDRTVSSNPLGSSSLHFNPFGDFVDATVTSVRKKSREMQEKSNNVEMNPNPHAG